MSGGCDFSFVNKPFFIDKRNELLDFDEKVKDIDVKEFEVSNLCGFLPVQALGGSIGLPLLDLAAMVEGFFRTVAGLIVWSVSLIPIPQLKNLREAGEGLLNGGYVSVVEGASTFVRDVGYTPLALFHLCIKGWENINLKRSHQEAATKA